MNKVLQTKLNLSFRQVDSKSSLLGFVRVQNTGDLGAFCSFELPVFCWKSEKNGQGIGVIANQKGYVTRKIEGLEKPIEQAWLSGSFRRFINRWLTEELLKSAPQPAAATQPEAEAEEEQLPL